MRHKSDFVAIDIGDVHFPTTPFSVKRRENYCISMGFDALIHTQYRIRISDSYCVELAVVETKSECSVFLQRKHDGCQPHCLGRFTHNHRQHLGDFMFLRFPCACSSLVWRGMNWAFPCSVEFNTVLGWLNSSQVSFPHVSEF